MEDEGGVKRGVRLPDMGMTYWLEKAEAEMRELA